MLLLTIVSVIALKLIVDDCISLLHLGVAGKFLLAGSGGDKPYDYKQEIGTALTQANQPKSALAQNTNTYLTNNLSPILDQLMNAQNLGNSIGPNQVGLNSVGANVASAPDFSNPLKDFLPQLASKSFSNANLGQVGGIDSVLNTLLNRTSNSSNDIRTQANAPVNVNTSTLDSIAKILGTKQSNDVADLRARFGAAGGTSRGTPAAYAEAQLKSQQIPELQQALSAASNQEFSNQLNSKSLTLQSLLGANSNESQNLGTLLNTFSTTRGQDITNTQGTQQNNLGLIDQLVKAAGGAGQQDLGLGSLFNQGAQINNQNNQFNAEQGNDLNKFLAGLNQSSNESQINRQFTGLQNLLQSIVGLAGAGTPGGGANVSVGNQQGSSGNGGSLLGTLGSLAPLLGLLG